MNSQFTYTNIINNIILQRNSTQHKLSLVKLETTNDTFLLRQRFNGMAKSECFITAEVFHVPSAKTYYQVIISTTHNPTYSGTLKDLELQNDLPIDLKNSIWLTKEEMSVYEYPLKGLVGKWHGRNRPVNYQSPLHAKIKPKTNTNVLKYSKKIVSSLGRLKATRDSLDTPSCIRSIATKIINDNISETEAFSDTASYRMHSPTPSIHSKASESTIEDRILSDYEPGIESPDYVHVNTTDIDSKSSHE